MYIFTLPNFTCGIPNRVFSLYVIVIVILRSGLWINYSILSFFKKKTNLLFLFFVGATLGKGVNRGLATFLASSLGVAAHRLATFTGSDKLQPIILGSSVFSIGN